jgi:hypothetical protein
LSQFAVDLRKLREKAGSPPYRELGRRAHYAAGTLSDAAAGRKLPTLAVTRAYVRACKGDVGEWEKRYREVVEELAVAAGSPAVTEGPFPGDAAFGPDDADRFFGREDVVARLTGMVASERSVVVYGASGAGKSSVLRAGLVARIRSSGPVILMTPGPFPLGECAARLAELAGEPAGRLRAGLAADAANLHRYARRAVPAPDADLLVVVDQFEEVFTRCRDRGERDAFLAALGRAARDPDSRVRVVLGVRADFLARCAEIPVLAEVPRTAQMRVGAMTTEQLRSAIVRPAAEAGHRVDSALLATLMAETARQAGALPLVSRALRETWRCGGALTLEDYRAAGGITRSLVRVAEDVYDEFDDVQRAIARDLFTRLAEPGEETVDTARHVHRRELDTGPDLDVVVERLVRARLVTVDTDGLDVAHDALIRDWPRLRGWLTADRPGLAVHRRLTETTGLWEAANGDPALVYRGARLESVLGWSARARLTGRERRFLDAGVAVRDAEERRGRERARRIRQLGAVVVASGAIAVVSTVAALVRRGDR